MTFLEHSHAFASASSDGSLHICKYGSAQLAANSGKRTQSSPVGRSVHTFRSSDRVEVQFPPRTSAEDKQPLPQYTRLAVVQKYMLRQGHIVALTHHVISTP